MVPHWCVSPLISVLIFVMFSEIFEHVVGENVFAARFKRAATYCEGRARKVDVRELEYVNVAGFQDSG